MPRHGFVKRETLQRLRALYEGIWSRPWPHDDDYLREIWRETTTVMPGDRFAQKRRHEFATTRMRECHEFTD